MMTVVTTTNLRPGAEDEWDDAIRQRFESAHQREGWVSGQILTPTDSSGARVLVGTWQTRENWAAWHDDPDFLEQRTRLEELEAEPSKTVWYTVVADAHAGNA